MSLKKPILLLDFDGVIHSYSSGWQGARSIPDPPVKGAMQFIIDAQEHFQVCIYSARSSQWGGRRAMKKWLRGRLRHYVLRLNLEFIEAYPFKKEISMAERIVSEIMRDLKFPKNKPRAFLTIDDRAICFDGKFGDPEQLFYFEPWYKKGG